MTLLKTLLVMIVLWTQGLGSPAHAAGQSSLPPCPADKDFFEWKLCYGTFTFYGGGTYDGEFRDGTANGQGTLMLPNGEWYVGGWKSGERTGQGTYRFPNGDRYAGAWKSDRANGQGSMFSPTGQLLQNGIWVNGEFVQANSLPKQVQSKPDDPFADIDKTGLDLSGVVKRLYSPQFPVH